jgi:hypothetical protein
MSKCGPAHVPYSAASKLRNEDTAAQRLVEQGYAPAGTGQSSALLEPGLGGSVDDVRTDVVLQAGADFSQSALQHLVLTVDKAAGELRQHHWMVAEYAIGAKIGRAAIQQIGDGGRFPSRSSRRTHLTGPSGWHVDRRAHHISIFELKFDS